MVCEISENLSGSLEGFSKCLSRKFVARYFTKLSSLFTYLSGKQEKRVLLDQFKKFVEKFEVVCGFNCLFY